LLYKINDKSEDQLNSASEAVETIPVLGKNVWTILLLNAVQYSEAEQLQAAWRAIPILGTRQVPVTKYWYDQHELCLVMSNIWFSLP